MAGPSSIPAIRAAHRVLPTGSRSQLPWTCLGKRLSVCCSNVYGYDVVRNPGLRLWHAVSFWHRHCSLWPAVKAQFLGSRGYAYQPQRSQLEKGRLVAVAAPDPDRRVHADQGAHAVPPHLGRPLLPRRQYRRRRDEHGGYHGTNSAIGPSRLAKRPLDQRKTVSGGRVGCFSPKFARGSHRAWIAPAARKLGLMVVLGRGPQRHMPSDLGLLTRASRAAAPSSSLAGSSLRL